ncbi:MAG: proline--tRNA ligase [Candidatus Doudnabacteria bacterium]|nr:proline--tRNA ligase [Candidatus Doudnabacteria bacterium]
MRQSKLFLKTSKTVSEEDTIISSKLLKQAGYIKESVAGRYYFMPIGQRVQQKIIKVIKEEMDGAGAQEMVSPILHPLELWKETNRTNTAGFELMNVKDRRGSDFALGGTAEEMFVDFVRKFTISYRDLPFNLYQFSPKFRDELRARGGLLRVREFIMKDAYSFHADEADFRIEYTRMQEVYSKIFTQLGLATDIVAADNGYIGGEYCHEFIAESDVGESRYFITEDGALAAHEDVAVFQKNPANVDAEMLPLEQIEQPDWVRNMDENEKHYGKTKNHFLKNVVYKNSRTGQIVIATVTGDLEVNKTKLEQVTKMVGQLEDAEESDLANLGTKSGYVHSWGYANVLTVADNVFLQARNLIGGQKEETADVMNVNYGRDFTCDIVGDIAMAAQGSLAPNGKKYIEKKGIEVGNVFQLGYHYSSLMKGASFTAEDGTEKPYYMGCYGIGVGRTMAAIVERYHDAQGIIWPESVAPFKVHLLALAGKEGEAVMAAAENLYDTLTKAGVEVLFDDRATASAGEKFADADLIGIPHRLIISAKTLAEQSVEYKKRAETESQLVPLDRVQQML